jgi:hypothetical protein
MRAPSHSLKQSWYRGHPDLDLPFENLNYMSHCWSIKLIILDTPTCNLASQLSLIQIDITM